MAPPNLSGPPRREPGLKRTLLVLVGFSLGIVAASLVLAEAQETGKRPFRVGFVHPAWGENPPRAHGLKAGLKAAGLEEGRDVVFEARASGGSLQVLP
jgi:hypothetical protein